MKTHFKILILLVTLSPFFYACDSDETIIEPTNSIIDAAARNNLTALLAAATEADLVDTLNGEGDFTVLAPTNQAFTQFLQDNNFANVSEVPKALLTQILLNHVIDGTLRSTDLNTGYANTLAKSDASDTDMSIYINTTDGVTFNGTSNVTIANIAADNGVIHVVDKVIALPNIVTFATADPNFSILVSALTREDNFTYVNTLATANGTAPAPFTVFAPTNTAFGNLLEELDVNQLSDIATPTLTSTLNTHVVAGANVTEDMLSNNMLVETLGGSLTVNLSANGATLTDSKDRVSNIIATDVQANNGVIHAIDKVVLE